MPHKNAIQWNDATRTGVAEMDDQHRILVDTLIEATERLSGNPGSRLFDRITRDLLAYAIYHFGTEEKLMAHCRYADAAPDDAALHLAQHRQFSQRVVALRAEASQGGQESRDALLAFLRDWLVNHILTTDQRLGRFISAQRAEDPT
jgi:hemerythrin